jgi:hypothetical protein
MSSRARGTWWLGIVAVLASAPSLAGQGFAPTPDPIERASVQNVLAAVAANRLGIVERLVATHADAARAAGVPIEAVRTALLTLREDQLLAASLVHSFADVGAIVARQASEDAAAVQAPFDTKDGSGSGPNSWIGYTAGSNVASGSGSAVAAGRFNTASGQNAFVAAGQSNAAQGVSSLVLGGFDNRATVVDATVVAGAGNRATGARSVVVGGGYNLASGQWSFIGGGGRRTLAAGSAGSYIEDNIANGDFSFVGGGQSNGTSGQYAAVAGGSNNAPGAFGNVAGGRFNSAAGYASSIPGGDGNTTGGAYSLAFGISAHANAPQCVVFALWSSTLSLDCLGAPNVFRIGADHGFGVEYFGRRDSDGGGIHWVYLGDLIPSQTIATWTGAYLSDSGVWSNASDRALKTDFEPIDARDTLRRVASLPIQRWRYRSETPDVAHVGPVAQDFRAAFGLGSDDKAIGTVDADGVALLAIQGLYQELGDRDSKIADQQRRIAALERQIADLVAKRQRPLRARAAVTSR